MQTHVTFFLASALALPAIARADQPHGKPRAQHRQAQSAALPPPAPLIGGSDSCATGDPIAGVGSFAFDNTVATTGVEGQGESACNQFGLTGVKDDVWFRWTAPSSGIAHVTTVNHTVVDTKIAAYPSTGGCPASGSALACNDDDVGSGTFQSTIDFACTAGNAYLIQVGLYPGMFPSALPGTGTFQISVISTVANDDCTSPVVVTGFGPGAPHNYDTTAATTGSQGQTNLNCELFATRAIDADVWFRWTATSSTWVRLTTCAGATTDTKIAVYAGAGCPSVEPVVCDDDACGTSGGPAEARWFATIGTAYTIQLGSFPGTPGGPGFFTIEGFGPALGDNCLVPIRIAGPGPHVFDNAQATTGTQGQNEVLCTQPGDPNPRITFDVWYVWTSTSTGMATWNLCNGTALDTKIAAYAGSVCPTGSSLGCNDDACTGAGPSTVTFPVSAGQQYVLQLGIWPGALAGSGTFTIAVGNPIGTSYCFGDGSGSNCPCSPGLVPPGEPGNGCANSIYDGGANLWIEGSASVSADTLTLVGSGMPNASCLYFQGTTRVNNGLGGLFGDGLRCAGGSVQRLRTRMNVFGMSRYPGPGDTPVSVLGTIPLAGGVRTYQAWYRNATAFCSMSTFNLTNAVEVAWTP